MFFNTKVQVGKLDTVALLVADPASATSPLSKILLFQFHHFTLPEMLNK